MVVAVAAAVALATGTSASGLASVLFNSNVARGGDGGTNPGAGTSTGLTQQSLTDLSKGIPGQTPRINYGNLQYPKQLKLENTDAIQFTMISYGTKSYNTKI